MSDSVIVGCVKGSELAQPIVGAMILRKDNKGNIIESCKSDSAGNWRLSGINRDESIYIKSNGYVDKEVIFEELNSVIRLLEDKLIGWQEKLWFLPNEKVTVFVHSPVDYEAALYRHGQNKETVLQPKIYKKQCQNVPNGYFVQDGLKWQSGFQYVIPATAKPGIYSLLLSADGEEPFAIPMVVSTPQGEYGNKNNILVLASTNTWQSYNIWGGRSRYRNFELDLSKDFINHEQESYNTIKKFILLIKRLVPKQIKQKIKSVIGYKSIQITNDWVYEKLSIKRPFTNCQLEGEDWCEPFSNHLAGGEWRFLAWLEREGIGYDYISGYELHTNPELLQYYQAIILSTHCEYWTKEMFFGLKSYHENNKLWVINVSGNSIFRQIEFFEDGSSKCVSLSFKDSCFDETQLLGVRFTESDYATCAPYKILERDHWIFKGAPINDNTHHFGGASLNQNTKKRTSRYDPGRTGMEDGLVGIGASGWETDKLSETAPKDFVVVAKGTNPKGGADMVIREPQENRGGVFSASSLVFSAAVCIDEVCSIIVKNVISRVLNHE